MTPCKINKSQNSQYLHNEVIEVIRPYRGQIITALACWIKQCQIKSRFLSHNSQPPRVFSCFKVYKTKSQCINKSRRLSLMYRVFHSLYRSIWQNKQCEDSNNSTMKNITRWLQQKIKIIIQAHDPYSILIKPSEFKSCFMSWMN